MIQNCYLLVSEDHYFKNLYIKQLKKEYLHDENDMMNSYFLEDTHATYSNIYDICDTYPFLTEYKFLHVKNSGLFKAGKTDESKKVLKWISELPNYVILVFDEDKSLIDGRNALYKKLHKESCYKEFLKSKDPTKDLAIINLIKEKALEYQVKIDSNTLTYFLDSVDADVYNILNEFYKLALYHPVITKDHIDQITNMSLSKTIFNMYSFIAKKNVDESLVIYHHLIENGSNEIAILAAMNTHFKSLLKTKCYMEKHGIHVNNAYNLNNEVKKQMSIKIGVNQFALNQMIEQANFFTIDQLDFLMKQCLEADESIKTGKMKPFLTVQNLIIMAAYL